MKRALPYLPLVLGTLALAWGLFALSSVFDDEHTDAVRALDDERAQLSVFAKHQAEGALLAHLEGTRADFERARDPLVAARGELWEGAKQIRPLWSLPVVDKVPSGANAIPNTEPLADGFFLKSLTLGLWTGRVTAAQVSDPVVRERVAAVRALAEAADAGDKGALQNAATRWALHREQHVLAPWWEAATGLAGLAILVNQEVAPLDGRFLEPAFFARKNLARPGVVTHLLDAETRERIPRRDLEELLSLARSLAKDAGILPPTFDALSRELLQSEPGPPPFTAGLWLKPGLLGHSDDERSIVLSLDLDAKVRELELPRAGLEPRLVLEGDDWSDRWRIELSEAPFVRAREAAGQRLQLKRGLLGGALILWAAVVGLSFMLVRRRQRFVELKDGFVSAVSHELRTPLASIRVQAETLERRLKDDPRARDYPTRIVKDIDGLSFLVENLLSFSRLERGRITPSLSRVRVDELVAQTREHLARVVTIPIEWKLTGIEGVTLEVDPDLVKLCLDNLAKNAAQYNERRPVEIEVSGRAGPDGYRLRVTDNGGGIDEADRARVFEDFYRGRTERAVRGSGLGLAICDAVMRAHRGSIALVDSGPEGTTFELAFPRESLVE